MLNYRTQQFNSVKFRKFVSKNRTVITNQVIEALEKDPFIIIEKAKRHNKSKISRIKDVNFDIFVDYFGPNVFTYEDISEKYGILRTDISGKIKLAIRVITAYILETIDLQDQAKLPDDTLMNYDIPTRLQTIFGFAGFTFEINGEIRFRRGRYASLHTESEVIEFLQKHRVKSFEELQAKVFIRNFGPGSARVIDSIFEDILTRV